MFRFLTKRTWKHENQKCITFQQPKTIHLKPLFLFVPKTQTSFSFQCIGFSTIVQKLWRSFLPKPFSLIFSSGKKNPHKIYLDSIPTQEAVFSNPNPTGKFWHVDRNISRELGRGSTLQSASRFWWGSNCCIPCTIFHEDKYTETFAKLHVTPQAHKR